MRSGAKLGALAALALVGGAAACATTEDTKMVTPVPEGRIPADEPSDASAPADAGGQEPDAGPCSVSGLCRVPVPIDTRVHVTAIAGSGPTDVWAVGSSRTILHYDGAAWQKTEIPADVGQVTMRAVWLGGPDDVWIADGRFIRHSTGWKGSATEWTSWMGASGDSNGLPTSLGGKEGRVFIGRQVSDINPAAAIVTCAGMGELGPIERTNVTAPALERSDLGTSARTVGVWSVAVTRSDEAWATKFGSERVVRVHRAMDSDGGSPDAGMSWVVEEHDSHSTKDLLGAWGDEQTIWLVGEGGAVRRMTRERIPTRLFEEVPSPASATLRGVYGFGTNDVWAVGDDATVLHWDGAVWSRIATPFDADGDKPKLVSVWGSGPDDVWIGGNGVMLHFEGSTP